MGELCVHQGLPCVKLWILVRASSPSPWRQGRGEPADGSHRPRPWFLDSEPWCTQLPVTAETLVDTLTSRQNWPLASRASCL